MGNENAEQIDDNDDAAKLAAEAEAKAKAEEEAKAKAEAEAKAKAEAEAKAQELRDQLESEGKTEEEIEAAIKDAETKAAGFEVVREGTQPQNFDQQQVNDIVSKRVKKLNSKVKEVSETANQTNAELELEKERNKILQIALEQAKGGGVNQPKELVKPNPADFEDGVNDPEFIKQSDEYTQALIDKKVADGIAKATETVSQTTNQEEQSKALLSKQVKHYEKAEEIGAPDYSETEDVALEILGNDYANQIIDNFDDSHVILYYLGKNPEEAKRLQKLIATSPVKGVAEMGRLSAELKLKPKQTTAPNPDEELKGDGSSDSQDAITKQLEKLRAEAAKTGDMSKLMAFKKKHAQ